MERALSVRVLINRIGEGEILDLKPGEYIQGCKLRKAVWTIVNVRIITGPNEVRR